MNKVLHSFLLAFLLLLLMRCEFLHQLKETRFIYIF